MDRHTFSEVIKAQRARLLSKNLATSSMQLQDKEKQQEKISMPESSTLIVAPEMLSYPATRLVDNLRANGARQDNRQRKISLERMGTKLEKRRQSLPVLPSYLTLQPPTNASPVQIKKRQRRKGVTFPLGVLMQQAVTEGDLQAIKQLIATGGDGAVEEREPNGLPPIMRAIFEDQLACLKFLLDSGADVSSRDPENWTALHVAAAMDDIEAAGLILASAGKRHTYDLLNSRNMDGERPIDLADSLQMAGLLLRADLAELRVQQTHSSASRESTTCTGSMSSEEGVLKLVEDHCEKHSTSAALDGVLKANTCYSSLLHLAAAKNYPHLANYVCRYHLSSMEIRDKNGWTPLHTAAYYNSLDVVLLLVEQRANIHALTRSFEKASDLSEHQLIQEVLEHPHVYLSSV